MPRSTTARSIATLSISFGLVSIPVKLYSATESASAIRFKLMSSGGAHVRQQYVAAEPAPAVEPPEAEVLDEKPGDGARKPREAASSVLDFPRARQLTAPRAQVLPRAEPAVIERLTWSKATNSRRADTSSSTAEELKALQEAARQTIDIVAFIPDGSVDPIDSDEAYYLAPDKARLQALQPSASGDAGHGPVRPGKVGLPIKEYVVQICAAAGGMVLQQLLYAEEVRSLADLGV